MKRIITIVTGIIFAFLIINGCQKIEPVKTSDNTITAVVDSNLFSATGGSVTAARSGNQLIITGIGTQSVRVTLTINNFTGNDEIIPIDGYVGIATIDSGTASVSNLNGTGSISYINFTETFPYLKGTFNFICTDSTFVTHGQFYIVAPAL